MPMTLRVLILLVLFCTAGNAEETKAGNPMVLHPERYIKITDFSIYSARGVGIIHHVTIENTGDIAYENVRVRVRYDSQSYTNYGTEVATEKGVLPVIVPPRSKQTYLEGGAVLGASSTNFRAKSIEVLGAVPLTGGN